MVAQPQRQRVGLALDENAGRPAGLDGKLQLGSRPEGRSLFALLQLDRIHVDVHPLLLRQIGPGIDEQPLVPGAENERVSAPLGAEFLGLAVVAGAAGRRAFGSGAEHGSDPRHARPHVAGEGVRSPLFDLDPAQTGCQRAELPFDHRIEVIEIQHRRAVAAKRNPQERFALRAARFDRSAQAIQVAPAGARSHRRPSGAAQLERPVGHQVLAAGRCDHVGELDRLCRQFDDPHVGHVHRARLGEPDLQPPRGAYIARGAKCGMIPLPRRAHRELGRKPRVEPALGLLDRNADRPARQPRGPHPAGELVQAVLDQVHLAVLGQHGVAVAARTFATRADQPGKRFAIGILLASQSLGHVDRGTRRGPILGLAAGRLREIAVGDQVDRLSGLSRRNRRQGQQQKEDQPRHDRCSFEKNGSVGHHSGGLSRFSWREALLDDLRGLLAAKMGLFSSGRAGLSPLPHRLLDSLRGHRQL